MEYEWNEKEIEEDVMGDGNDVFQDLKLHRVNATQRN